MPAFLNLLMTKYDLEYSQNPDLLFCSVFTNPTHLHLRYDCMKCLINAELPERVPNLTDYSFSGLPTGHLESSRNVTLFSNCISFCRQKMCDSII